MDITEVAGYRIVRQLGAGGMGQVFLVEHPRLPRQDALKLLDAGVSRNDDFKARFQREADLLARLSHPNIVTLHDRGEFDGRLWITMEYVAGTDAAGLLKARGPLDLDLALQLTSSAGAALDYAWRKQRITHRDVKPANILVGIDQTESGPIIEAVKLADFGIAKAAGEATALTSTGITVGTMQYISPEAIEGQSIDNRADIYSLGCTAFHLLAGRPPYSGSSITSLMNAHLTQQPPRVTEFAPWLPAAMDGVFERALAKQATDRYQSCAEFAGALQQARSGRADPAFAPTIAAPARPETGVASPDAITQLRKANPTRALNSRTLAVLVAAAAVAAIALVIAIGLRKHASPPSTASNGGVSNTEMTPTVGSNPSPSRTTTTAPAATTAIHSTTTQVALDPCQNAPSGCQQAGRSKWTEPLVLVSDHFVGAVDVGMTIPQIQAASGVTLESTGSSFNGETLYSVSPPLPSSYAQFQVHGSCISVGSAGNSSGGQVIKTVDGYTLNHSVSDFLRTYGSKARLTRETVYVRGEPVETMSSYTVDSANGVLIALVGHGDPDGLAGLLVGPPGYTAVKCG